MKKFKISSFIQLVIASLCLAIGSANAAEWVIDNQSSQLNFISIKKGNIAELHQFDEVQGRLDSQGKFVLNINLASVNTHNAVRDERMAKYFFNVDKFSTAKLTADIDLLVLDAIAEGASAAIDIDANLNLHGEVQAIKLNVIVTRLVGAKLSVVSAQPLLLNVEDYSLVSGVNKLMELAKLPSISHAVPVSFYLTFKLKP